MLIYPENGGFADLPSSESEQFLGWRYIDTSSTFLIKTTLSRFSRKDEQADIDRPRKFVSLILGFSGKQNLVCNELL